MTQVAEPGSARAGTDGRRARDRRRSTTGSAGGSSKARPAGAARSTTRRPAGSPARSTSRLADEVGAAVAAAKAAFPGWRATSLSKRTDILFRIRNLVETHRQELAAHLTAEHGKVPVGRPRRDRPRSREPRVRLLHPEPAEGRLHRAGVDRRRRLPDPPAARRRRRDHPVQLPGDGPDVDVRDRDRDCGNTFILKPSEKDPSASMFLAELLHEAGVPDGVFNVVHGDKVAVDAILEHPDIAAVSFVGSTPIARYIYETGTKNGKRVQALGGAKNHMIVLPDADIDMAADAAISAGYGSAGERCMAIATIVAVGDVADPLVEAITARLPKVKVGPGLRSRGRDGSARHAPAPGQGRLVSRQLRPAQGATVVADGREHPALQGVRRRSSSACR